MFQKYFLLPVESAVFNQLLELPQNEGIPPTVPKINIRQLKSTRKQTALTALVNIREGYRSVIICTPMEVLENEETE